MGGRGASGKTKQPKQGTGSGKDGLFTLPKLTNAQISKLDRKDIYNLALAIGANFQMQNMKNSREQAVNNAASLVVGQSTAQLRRTVLKHYQRERKKR